MSKEIRRAELKVVYVGPEKAPPDVVEVVLRFKDGSEQTHQAVLMQRSIISNLSPFLSEYKGEYRLAEEVCESMDQCPKCNGKGYCAVGFDGGDKGSGRDIIGTCLECRGSGKRKPPVCVHHKYTACRICGRDYSKAVPR